MPVKKPQLSEHRGQQPGTQKTFLEQKTCHTSKINQSELTLLSADKMKETLRYGGRR
jgi:hypothetical protein